MKARIKFNTTHQADDFITKYHKYSLGSVSQSEYIVTLYNVDDKAKIFTHYYLSELNNNKKRVDYLVELLTL